MFIIINNGLDFNSLCSFVPFTQIIQTRRFPYFNHIDQSIEYDFVPTPFPKLMAIDLLKIVFLVYKFANNMLANYESHNKSVSFLINL